MSIQASPPNLRHPGLDPGSMAGNRGGPLAFGTLRPSTLNHVPGDEHVGTAVRNATDPALTQAARGFEQIFLRQMIGAMRAGSLGDPLLGSAGEDQFRELFDARMAETMAAQGGGIGIGALLTAQLRGGAA